MLNNAKIPDNPAANQPITRPPERYTIGKTF